MLRQIAGNVTRSQTPWLQHNDFAVEPSRLQ
ncbi:Uncharacterised protein [Vibrio cholerae]|nr:Uncharacterised protein [Vibrio cholerae]